MSDQATTDLNSLEPIVSLCKRRGFIFQSSEIYGGINGFFDYGPLGVEMRKNIKEAWWTDMVQRRDDIVGLDCSIIMHPDVWKASGHLDGFSDPMQMCRYCKKLWRADQVWDILNETEWLLSLKEIFGGAPETQNISVYSADLMKWARKTGKKKAPNLAFVRNTEVTLSWLSEFEGKTIDIISCRRHW